MDTLDPALRLAIVRTARGACECRLAALRRLDALRVYLWARPTVRPRYRFLVGLLEVDGAIDIALPRPAS